MYMRWEQTRNLFPGGNKARSTDVQKSTSKPFTEDIVRAVNIVHVVDATGRLDSSQNPTSYMSLFSTTPGKLTKEIG